MTMTSMTALLILVLVSLSVSTLLVLVLTRPLSLVLRQLCPGSDATVFWTAFTCVMLYVAPLLISVVFGEIPATPVVVWVVRSALAASLTGAFAALLVIGYQIARARPR
jgi:hypothetical protein